VTNALPLSISTETKAAVNLLRDELRNAEFMSFICAPAPVIITNEEQVLLWLEKAAKLPSSRLKGKPGRRTKEKAELWDAAVDDTITIQDVAKLIGGPSGVPPWLPNALREQLGRLKVGKHFQRYRKEPQQLRPKAVQVQKAADFCISLDWMDPAVRSGLAQVASCARSAAEFKKPSGAPRKQKLASLTDQCAAVICLAWKQVRGECPKPGNVDCQRACDSFWMLLGGKPHQPDNANRGRIDAWRDHIKGVLPLLSSSFVRFVARDYEQARKHAKDVSAPASSTATVENPP
jgi:hypothetical protein